MKYEVIFFSSSDDNEVIVKQKFDSFNDANKWASDCEYNYNDIAIDEEGNDYWKTFYRYYNPEDKENYSSYEVKECIS
jgi:hypothetical protein